MATAIQTWQIVDNKLTQVSTSFSENGRKEFQDLEKWIKTNPEILGNDIALIGEQVILASGRLDFLAVDRLGNLVVIELKRDNLSRDVLAQAIDYAAVLATYEQEQLNEICKSFTGREFGVARELGDYLSERFPDADFEEISVNQTQRILLVGFSIDESLQRMIEWLSEKYSLAINAIALKYTKTSSGDELLSRISIIPEAVEIGNVRKRKFVIAMSDEPGNYDEATLKAKLTDYLAAPMWSAKRLREAFLPALLENQVVTRAEMKKKFIEKKQAEDDFQAGRYLAIISQQLNMKWNDFLRQVIGYGTPNYSWKKDNFCIQPSYRTLVEDVLKNLKTNPQLVQEPT